MEKRVIKIFGLPSHQTLDRTSGVDMVRVIQPLTLLNGYEDDEVKFEVDLFRIKEPKQPNWIEVAQKYDIIFLNYTANAWAFAGMGAMARHWKRKIIMDVDDDLYSIMPDNPSYNVYKEGSEHRVNLTSIYNEVDYITYTTKYLKNVLLSKCNKISDKIKVFPNYVDMDKLYIYRPPFKDTLNIQLSWFGSTTHFLDLYTKEFREGMDMIFKEYPNVTFKTIGANITKFNMKWGQRYSQGWGDTDIFKWVKDKFPLLMNETDIMVVPLQENRYTVSKSNIKFLEASSAGKPGVYQDMKQYRDVIYNGKNGFLASTAEDWYRAIKTLIEDKELRRKMGINAFNTVKKYFQAKDHIYDYANFFKEIVI